MLVECYGPGNLEREASRQRRTLIALLHDVVFCSPLAIHYYSLPRFLPFPIFRLSLYTPFVTNKLRPIDGFHLDPILLPLKCGRDLVSLSPFIFLLVPSRWRGYYCSTRLTKRTSKIPVTLPTHATLADEPSERNPIQFTAGRILARVVLQSSSRRQERVSEMAERISFLLSLFLLRHLDGSNGLRFF